MTFGDLKSSSMTKFINDKTGTEPGQSDSKTHVLNRCLYDRALREVLGRNSMMSERGRIILGEE